MVPFTCRLLVSVASLMVPQPNRREWKSEWDAELWHRAEMGADPRDLLRCASGVFRDAAWFRQSEHKKNGYDLFRKPLRVEALFLAAALLIAIFSGALLAPHMPYADAGRLVSFERNVPFMGALDSFMSPRLPKLFQDSPAFSGTTTYRLVRTPVLGLRVSRNFFDVLGSKPLLGRTFLPSDPAENVVLPYDVWRGRLHSDPHVIGKKATIDSIPYTIVGVMPPEFWFRTPRVQFFALYSSKTDPGGIVGRLRLGVSVDSAQALARQTAFKVEPRWFSDALELHPVLHDDRLRDLLFALEIALIGAVLGMAFLVTKGLLRRPRYWLMLGARISLTVTGLALLRMSVSGHRSALALSWELFAFWIFLLACSAAVVLLVIDHRGRCLVCLSKLRKPVAIGLWSSQILDQPATEYICPEGHGTLYVAETGNAPDYWTVLDDTWRDLFAHGKH